MLESVGFTYLTRRQKLDLLVRSLSLCVVNVEEEQWRREAIRWGMVCIDRNCPHIKQALLTLLFKINLWLPTGV